MGRFQISGLQIVGGWCRFSEIRFQISFSCAERSKSALRMLARPGMNPKADELKARTKRFALDILRFYRTLPNSDAGRDIGRQLMRAATGVASNYRATCRARSDAEFAARLGVVLEEADESLFWLELITEDGLSRSEDALRMMDEASQLTAIFAASTITARARLEQTTSRQRHATRPSYDFTTIK